MNIGTRLSLGVAAVAVSAFSVNVPARLEAQQAVSIGDKDLGGVVSGPNGPEAGVWVIAETSELPTKMAKIVVTDDQGRYVLPDLPQANYSVWVRGYGLVDSPKVQTAPGKILNLAAVPAPNAAAAAEYYPPVYWLSMAKLPTENEFPGTGYGGNGINENIKTQARFLREFKTDGCFHCHAVGTKATRTIPEEFGKFKSGYEAWTRRIQSGQASKDMVATIERFGTERGLRIFSDWTDRIAAGELPATKPPRPQGLERNVVITVWDWSGPKTYLHDEISTDKRNPTLNPYGKLYGATENSTDDVPILDPVANSTTTVKLPVSDPKTPSAINTPELAPSAYWGDEKLWHAQTIPHSLMFDEKGRVWFAARSRVPKNNPDFCRKGSDHPSAKLFPIEQSNRQVTMLDPKTGKFTMVDTCFPTHHVQFGFDKDRTLWASSGGPGAEVLGWINTKVLDETGDQAKAQGWTAFVLDTNGNGKRDEGYVEPNQPVDPTKDKRIRVGFYAVAPSPVDDSIWGTVTGFPGSVVRVDPGSNPPATALAEIYQVPLPGFGPRGGDIDTQGVMWAALASGHLGSFDRRKCKGPLNGPKATGNHCPEGWTLYPLPGPQLGGVTQNGSGETPYYAWVDQHDTFGLGKDVPFATGNQNDSLIALKDGKPINLVVPYPMGFWAKALDGRIDDANAGWKGRGVWSNTGNRTPFHLEGGKGTTPKIVHFQMRPDPLAR